MTIVVGARPNFMKAWPILRAISRYNLAAAADSRTKIQPILVHTGQHYDAQMSDSFFADLNLPKPNIFLGVGSGSHAAQTAEVMRRFEGVLLQEKPDIVLVVGDVNSTAGSALATAKVPLRPRPLIAHVEAGLRSFDREMPEECNRIITDHLSDFLFVTEHSALTNLSREGIPHHQVYFVGNTMIDTLLAFASTADRSQVLSSLGLLKRNQENGHGQTVRPYALLTLHRPANVDNPAVFVEIMEGLQEVARSHEIVFPAHPRTECRIRENHLESYFHFASHDQTQTRMQPGNEIRLIKPQGYLDFVCLMKNAALMITDSGGIQEESICLGVPCVTLRENTERPVTLDGGMNVLGGVKRETIRRAIGQQLLCRRNTQMPELWDGDAGRRIVEVLASFRQSEASGVGGPEIGAIKSVNADRQQDTANAPAHLG